MARLRYNGLTATLGAALTSSATSVTFGAALTHANGVAVPTITSPDYIPLSILDSGGNLSEIVYLTAYTSGATTGTITRAAEGAGAAVAHSSGDKVVHGPTAGDLTFTGCRATRSAAITAGSGTAFSVTAIAWDSEDYDTNGFHDTTTNPSRITIPAGLDGYYAVKAGVVFADDSTGRTLFRLYKNGAAFAGGSAEMQGGTGIFPGAVVSTEMRLVAGDYVEIVVMIGANTTRRIDPTLSAMTLRKIG